MCNGAEMRHAVTCALGLWAAGAALESLPCAAPHLSAITGAEVADGSGAQGITTVVVGADGSSPWPIGEYHDAAEMINARGLRGSAGAARAGQDSFRMTPEGRTITRQATCQAGTILEGWNRADLERG
jgi:hypothetical protein